MSSQIIYALLSVLAVSLFSLVGVFTLSLKENLLKKFLFVAVGLAVGALLGDSFIHLIPEAIERTNFNFTLVAISVIVGILIFFILEKALHWHHHHGPEDREHHIHHVGSMVLVSDGIHNLIDGLIIGASFLISTEVGFATTIAVVLHEIPQEIGDFGVLLHAGYSKIRALWLNFLSALISLVGVAIALILADSVQGLITFFIPIAAGGFIYIAMSDLIPELQKTKKISHTLVQLISVILGVFLMSLLILLE